MTKIMTRAFMVMVISAAAVMADPASTNSVVDWVGESALGHAAEKSTSTATRNPSDYTKISISVKKIGTGMDEDTFNARELIKSTNVSRVIKSVSPGCVGHTISGDFAKAARECAVDVAIDAAAIPTVVGAASVSGVSASTGTAISSLGGAAATSATLAAVGTTVAEGAAAVGVTIAAAPAVVGGAVLLGVAAGVAWGVNSVIDLF